ncbi:hypothetical protein TSAR_014222 [Trichomalopsis sarcophagae]|uniref:Uncharacterized protein n=1 Tax=Trichomalopsis sarcophagae TaxID=543379 RepID=A0A232FM35_9HYME|nr:hypothetical protein TSAR_014222 [Trichomalopsis sarcophagae]
MTALSVMNLKRGSDLVAYRQPTSNHSESRLKCFTTKAIIFLREYDFCLLNTNFEGGMPKKGQVICY